MENENAFMQQLASALVVLMQPEIERAVNNLLPDFDHEIESVLGRELPGAVEDQVYSQLEDQLHDAVEGALDARLGGAGVEDEVAARIEQAVAAALPGVLRAALVDLITPALASLRDAGAPVVTLASEGGR